MKAKAKENRDLTLFIVNALTGDVPNYIINEALTICKGFISSNVFRRSRTSI